MSFSDNTRRPDGFGEMVYFLAGFGPGLPDGIPGAEARRNVLYEAYKTRVTEFKS